MDRVPPHSEEAERGALGSMLLDPLRVIPIARVNMGIKPGAFYLAAHREICQAIYDLADAGKGVDKVLVRETMKQAGTLEGVGGEIMLERLILETPTATHAEWYLDIVRQKSLLRGLILTARDVEAKAYEAERGDTLLGEAAANFAGLAGAEIREEESNAAAMAAVSERWAQAHAKQVPAIGLELPWPVLTEMLCGLEVGVTILAGRPSAGKTTMEDCISVHCASKGLPVLRFTLDASRRQLLARTLSRKAGVSLPKLKYGYAGTLQFAAIAMEMGVVAKYPMWINERDREINAIRTVARAMKVKADIELITLDYIQLVGAAEMGRSEWDRVAKVSYVSGALKALAYELKVPILVLSQLSRGVEQEDRDPVLSDLRDSGAIEQDAEKVVFLYQDRKQHKEMEKEDPGSTKHLRPVRADVVKHKDGETGRVCFWMYPHYFRFDETDQSWPRPTVTEGAPDGIMPALPAAPKKKEPWQEVVDEMPLLEDPNHE